MRSAVNCCSTVTPPTVTTANSPSTRAFLNIERLSSGRIMSFAHLEAALGLAVAVGARTGVIVDGWRGQVHQQYGECDAIRITAPGANHVDENADASAEDQPAKVAGGAADRVGDDKERAEHGGAAEQVKQRRAVAVGARTIPEHQAHQCQRSEHAHRGVPAEQALVQQEQTAGKERQVDHLRADPAEMPEGWIGPELFYRQTFVQLHHVQCGGLAPAIGHRGNTKDMLQAGTKPY